MDVPYCPNWVYTTGETCNDRIYLGSTYLNYPDRHGTNDDEDELEIELFPEVDENDRRTKEVPPDLPHFPVDLPWLGVSFLGMLRNSMNGVLKAIMPLWNSEFCVFVPSCLLFCLLDIVWLMMHALIHFLCLTRNNIYLPTPC